MSSHLRPTKKQKIEPSRPPRATTKLPAWNTSNPRTRNVARADSESVPPSGDAMPASSAHRTQSQTVRKPTVPLDTFGLRANHVLTPNFQAAPRAGLQGADESDCNDSENEADKTESGEEGNDSTDLSDGEGYESSDEEDEDMVLEEVRADVADLDEEPKFQTEQELEVYIKSLRVKHAKQANRKAVRPKNKRAPHALVPAAWSSKSKTPAPTAKTVGDAVSEVRGEIILDDHHKILMRNHVLKCLVSLCGVKQAQDAARMIPRFTNTGEPDYFDKQGRLTPHFDRPFNENFQAWGKEFFNLATDPSRTSAMSKTSRTYLMSISCEQYRDVLSTAGFATMRDAWKRNQDGKGDEKKVNKNRATRRWARKTAKANRRRPALEGSGLDAAAFGFLADPGFQSSEYSDADDKSLCVVQAPKYRTEKVNQLLGALDIAFKEGKKRAGNPQFFKYHYHDVDIKVQPLKSKSKVPRWVVKVGWDKENPKLERGSRPFINSREAQMPQGPDVDQFIHDYEPDQRFYPERAVDSGVASDIDDLDAGLAPVLAPLTAPVQPAAQPPVEHAQPIGQLKSPIATLVLPDSRFIEAFVPPTLFPRLASPPQRPPQAEEERVPS